MTATVPIFTSKSFCVEDVGKGKREDKEKGESDGTGEDRINQDEGPRQPDTIQRSDTIRLNVRPQNDTSAVSSCWDGVNFDRTL